MSQFTLGLAALILSSYAAVTAAAEADKETMRPAQDDQACAGVSNESTKMRELRRELGVYIGQTVPEELQHKVRKHIEQVAKLKAECDRQRGKSVQSR